MTSQEEKYKEAQERRNVKFLNTVLDLSLGTLWWVKNELWRQKILNFDLEHPDANHPAVSLGRKSYTSLTQVVPMLLGSHSNTEGFPVKGVTRSEQTTHSFFCVRPHRFQVKNAIGKPPGFFPNTFKHRLSDLEERALRQYLARKGVEFDEV